MAQKRKPKNYAKSVFINCPFDKDYLPMLRAALFVTYYLGLEPRTSMERGNAGEPRINKILELIQGSKYGIHDLSRLQMTEKEEFARLNMPFELGLDLAVQHIIDKKRCCLVVETERYRFQKALSDLSGNDIREHRDDPKTLMKVIREWIHQNHNSQHKFPQLEAVWGRYCDFLGQLQGDFELGGTSDDEINTIPISEYNSAMRALVQRAC